MDQIKMFIRNHISEEHCKRFLEPVISLTDGYSSKSYSQEGEDILLRRIFEDRKSGFYVDVGAHHPKRFSNTYLFYRKGWSGINIEAMPGSKKLFDKVRPRDVNLEIAISGEKETLVYYAFNDSALNSFSKEVSQHYGTIAPYKMIFKKEMETSPLSDVLDQYLPLGQRIDFLSVDVEGLDFDVLRSNNWEKYRPEVVLTEAFHFELKRCEEVDVHRFLHSKGYDLLAKTLNTLIYRRTKE
ncbi:MAG: FkbM family methyltransferase [Deltaproteobacteria bacterium]